LWRGVLQCVFVCGSICDPIPGGRRFPWLADGCEWWLHRGRVTPALAPRSVPAPPRPAQQRTQGGPRFHRPPGRRHHRVAPGIFTVRRMRRDMSASGGSGLGPPWQILHLGLRHGGLGLSLGRIPLGQLDGPVKHVRGLALVVGVGDQSLNPVDEAPTTLGLVSPKVDACS